MPTYAEIISIGDEILYGQTLDTNAHWISAHLDEIGIKVRRRSTVGDERSEIIAALREAEARSEIILMTGGLGPTNDDLTKPVLVEYFQTHLELDHEALAEIESLLARAGRHMQDLNRQQAELPANCRKITNKLGTAPGMWFEERGKVFVSMPGVPHEMKRMMKDLILPELLDKYVKGCIYHRIIRTIGVPESLLAKTIADWEDQLPAHIRLAYLPTLGQVKLRLTGFGDDPVEIAREVVEEVEKVLPLISKFVYGFDGDEIEKVVGDLLLEANKTIAFAESCTGGYLSHLITSVPGSSRYFKGTIVSYDYDVKINSLDVDQEVMLREGAVSEQVVIQMAKAVRQKLDADVGISISGIAGPGGGMEDKPVGTVWIAYSDEYKTVAKKFQFSKDRILNIQWSAFNALNMFRLNFLSN